MGFISTFLCLHERNRKFHELCWTIMNFLFSPPLYCSLTGLEVTWKMNAFNKKIIGCFIRLMIWTWCILSFSCFCFDVFARDGVSESQFSQVLNYELDQIIKVLYTGIFFLLCIIIRCKCSLLATLTSFDAF